MSDWQYRGQGRYIVGVPARDLSAAEVAQLPERTRARLVKSGLYVAIRPVKVEKEVDAHV